MCISNIIFEKGQYFFLRNFELIAKYEFTKYRFACLKNNLFNLTKLSHRLMMGVMELHGAVSVSQ